MDGVSYCTVCARADAMTAIEGICTQNLVFRPRCDIARRGSLAKSADATSLPETASAAAVGVSVKATQAPSPTPSVGLWKALALLGTLAGGAGGALATSTASGPPNSGSGQTSGNANARLSYQIEVANSCLTAGKHDCASFVIDEAKRENPKNADLMKLEASLSKAVSR